MRSERKRLSSQLNPIRTGRATSAISIGRCDECPSKDDCDSYRAGAACQIEINIRRNLVQQFKAFTGTNPQDMMIEIMRQYRKLEQVSQENPTSYNLSQQIWLLLAIYKLKFGKGKG